MSRKLVAYGSDDESPDRRKSRDESFIKKKDQDEMERSLNPRSLESTARKMRKNSERWTASSGDESAREDESETSSSRSQSDQERHVTPPRKRPSNLQDKRVKLEYIKPPKALMKGLDSQPDVRLPITQSQSSLVSYGGGEDEEEDQFAKADKRAAIELKQEKLEMEDQSRSSTVIREPKPPRGHEDSRSPDEIAVDNILEEGVRELAQPYNQGADSSVAGSTPHSFDGAESPLHAEIVEEIMLPPTPPGSCSPRLQERFEEYFKKKGAGCDLNQMIKKRRDFKNPSMYEQLIEKFNVDELGSNFNPRVFDPHGFSDDCFYDTIGAMQKELMEKHNAAAEKRAAAAKSESSKSNDVKRKSRFDGAKKH